MTVGARKDLQNEKFNILPLCNWHHRQKEGRIPESGCNGLTDFVVFHLLSKELENRGFKFSTFTGKWFYLKELK